MDDFAPSETKVLSVRVPANEAQSVDSAAKMAGLSRNDYMRMRLKADAAFVEIEGLMQLIDMLRQIEKSLDDYVGLLEKLLVIAEEVERRNEVIALILEEISNTEGLMGLVFRAQSQTVRLIRALRRKVDKPL